MVQAFQRFSVATPGESTFEGRMGDRAGSSPAFDTIICLKTRYLSVFSVFLAGIFPVGDAFCI